MKDYRWVRLGHGYYPGGVIAADIAPTIAAKTIGAAQTFLMEIDMGKHISTYEDRYTEVLNKFFAADQQSAPVFMSVQGTERSFREDVSGCICARIDSSQAYAILEEEKHDTMVDGYNTMPDGTMGATGAIETNTNETMENEPLIPQVLRMERTEEEKLRRHNEGDAGSKFSAAKEYKPRQDGISNTITISTKDNMVMEPPKEEQTLLMVREMVKGKRDGSATAVLEADGTIRGCYNVGKHDSSISEMIILHENNAGHTGTTAHAPKVYGQSTRYRIRKLTPRECFRLMDVSEEDIDKIQAAGISKTQQYKMAGNSIVVSCLYEIFKAMFVEPVREKSTRQLELF